MNQPKLISHYRVIEHLGSGGFGDTFLVQDVHLPSGKICVLKQLKPINNNPEVYQLVKERFKREAVILEELGNNHPQIPSLYAYFEENGNFYLVQEYIEGKTLTKIIKNQGIIPEKTVQFILIKILEVLEYIETKGIIHRDIKPDNILIRQSDQLPVLIDFGAVRETMGTELTLSGNSTSSIVIGTPGFMPSEQGIGRPVFASDLYALSLTIIYLLTGNNPKELETNPITGEIIWQEKTSNISSIFAKVLDQAIKPNAQQRFPTAQAMKSALLGESSQPTELASSTATTVLSSTINSEIIPQKKSLFNLTILIITVIILLSVSGSLFYFQQATKRNRELESRNRRQDTQNPRAISVPKTSTWRSESGLTQLPQLDDICWGESKINQVQTVFGYDKLPFRGTITINSPKTEGCYIGDTLPGYFNLTGTNGNCEGTVVITWQPNNNADISWNITNLGANCRVSQRDWSINTYPE
jgi:serine/threonine protein kinase